ncbi:MAG: nucleotidyltransferase domain-containing protein [Elusimicrobia bacterium]|nr:nucleotidyltransferase domain-containing protein [Elusimicrobiota bacterium]
MRLKREEISLIVQSVRELDNRAQILLFGSRTDNSKKGGDIDLLIISKKLAYPDGLIIRRKIFQKMDEQQIHLLICKSPDEPFCKIAYKEGIKL